MYILPISSKGGTRLRPALLDTDKVRLAFKETEEDDAKLVELAREVIPRLCNELDDTRMLVVKVTAGEERNLVNSKERSCKNVSDSRLLFS
jgi:hypothetical protein